ncbi:MAG: ribosome recycling factor [Vampirovibrionales bacterium]|nr:ribosome recycling factor [Vampirovibrionales bacterium]
MDEQTLLDDCKQRMQKAIAALENELATLRTGRANPALLDRVQADYYGTPTPIKQMANIAIQEGSVLVIQPYDKGQLAAIEKAIAKSELGLTPTSDGSVLRISVPPLSEERRKEFVKLAKKSGEDTKIAIRNVRRDASNSAEKWTKAQNMPEDAIHGIEEQIQKLTNKFVAEVDSHVAAKEKEILTI